MSSKGASTPRAHNVTDREGDARLGVESSLHLIASTDRRGAETFAVNLSRRLNEHHRADLIAWRGSTDEACHDVSILPSGTVRRLRKLRRLAAASDVVAAHGSVSLPACAVGLLGVATPFVYRSIGDPSWWVGESRWAKLRVTAFLKRATRVVALWPSAADALADRFGYLRERIDVIPNGVSVKDLIAGTPEPIEARERLGLDRERPTIGFVGSLSPEKNPEAVIRALGKLPDFQLVMAGGGPLRRDLENVATQVASGRVRILGPLDDVRPVLGASDVLALVSHTEGIPAAVLEAGVAGVPAVVSGVGGLPHVVVSGATGLVLDSVDIEDALPSALREAFSRRIELGTAAKERYSKLYDMGRVTRLWLKTLDRVAASDSSGIGGTLG